LTWWRWQVAMKEYRMAAVWPPFSDPRKIQLFLLWRALHNRNYADHAVMRSRPRRAGFNLGLLLRHVIGIGKPRRL
jgi:hypothetical protein